MRNDKPVVSTSHIAGGVGVDVEDVFRVLACGVDRNIYNRANAR